LSNYKRRVKTLCHVALHGFGDVRIQVKGRGDRSMAKPLLRDLRMNAGAKELGRMAVPQVMEPDTPNFAFVPISTNACGRHTDGPQWRSGAERDTAERAKRCR
jgi:hypothetical protein